MFRLRPESEEPQPHPSRQATAARKNCLFQKGNSSFIRFGEAQRLIKHPPFQPWGKYHWPLNYHPGGENIFEFINKLS